MTTDKRGVSALLLQRQLALRRYETAWMMLHKFRRAMVNLSRERLQGEVEVDDTWVGGSQAGLRGSRQLKGRKAALVLVAVEKRGRGTGRARMEVIPDFKGATADRLLETKRGRRFHRVYGRPQKLHRAARSGLQARTSHPARTHRAAEGFQVGGASGRSSDWEHAAVAHRNSSRREPRTASSLSG